MISACVVPSVNHGGGGVMVWGCFAGDTVCDLFRIECTLSQHGYHSILQQYAIPSDLRLVRLSFVFQQDNNPTHLVWDELACRVKEKLPTSAQHMWELLQDCWKSIPGEAS